MTHRRNSSPRGHLPRHSYARHSSRHFGRGGSRARRGDVRAAILALLADRPMHGYEMIKELEERTGGVWTPSAGSIYPTLQLLEDEGLIKGEEQEGKRRFELTAEGREQQDSREGKLPWDEVTAGADPEVLKLTLAQAAERLGRPGVLWRHRRAAGQGPRGARRGAAEDLLDPRRVADSQQAPPLRSPDVGAGGDQATGPLHLP